MIPTAQTAPGESASRPQPPIVTDQGGLVAGPMMRTASTPSQALIPRGEEGGSGSVLASAAVSTIVETAARAPSLHNTQPWIFRVAGDVVELHADPGRLLAYTDPVGRELTISCGAALFGLRLGFRQQSCLPAVHLWPDLTQPLLVARVWPDGQAATNRIEAELIAAVPHRHTHRGAFTPGDVSSRLLATLAADAAAEGAQLTFVESAGIVGELADLVDQAAADQDASAEISAESGRWLRPHGSQARDGVPAHAAAARDAQPAKRFRRRNFGNPGGAGDRTGADLAADSSAGEGPAATAVLVTAGDTADDWLRAGQALNRLLLRAATRWVFASLQSQPLELPPYREQVRKLLSIPGQPQMLLQFGRSNTAPATPRRRQAEFRTNENQA